MNRITSEIAMLHVPQCSEYHAPWTFNARRSILTSFARERRYQCPACGKLIWETSWKGAK
jgi:hypothetical protein